jgi:predicted aminopeptidase
MSKCALILLFVMSLFAGCTTVRDSNGVSGGPISDIQYLSEQAIGQVEILAASRSISDVLLDDTLDPITRRRLRLILAARTFARDTLGLTVGQQYRRITFLNGPAVVYVVSAARRTSLDSFEWQYPVLGSLPYRGFFALEDAENEATLRARMGLDVSVRPVTTYSLLGYLPDPIVSPMLRSGDELYLVETVIHELAHATVFATGASSFNEGMATFIGREGRRLFIDKTYGTNSAIYRLMLARDADRDAYGRAVAALAFELRVLFAQADDLDEREIMARKDEIYLRHQRHFGEEIADTMRTFRYRSARLPENNARLAAYGLYSLRQDVFRRAYRACQLHMPCLIRMLEQAALDDAPIVSLTKTIRRETLPEKIIQ